MVANLDVANDGLRQAETSTMDLYRFEKTDRYLNKIVRPLVTQVLTRSLPSEFAMPLSRIDAFGTT